MLNRQRVVLSLLDEAGGVASRLMVTKWAFLLREEHPSRGGSAFYQFLPYKYGPFSFCLFQEAAALTRDGYITESGHDWRLTGEGRKAARSTKPQVRAEIEDVTRAHAHKSSTTLVDYVYDRFPWYTVNSGVRRLECRPTATAAVYTAGYEGILIDGFLNNLMRVGIHRVIDVRQNPVSRRYGFHKSTLARLCGDVEIEYLHFPELGIPSQDRRDLDAPGVRDAVLDAYEKTTLSREGEAIDRVAKLVQDAPSVLVCMEACHSECHRSRLAKPVARKARLPIRHLELAS